MKQDSDYTVYIPFYLPVHEELNVSFMVDTNNIFFSELLPWQYSIGGTTIQVISSCSHKL